MEKLVSSSHSREVSNRLVKCNRGLEDVHETVRQILQRDMGKHSLGQVVGILGEAYLRLFLNDEAEMSDGKVEVLKLSQKGVHGDYFFDSKDDAIYVYQLHAVDSIRRGVTLTDYDLLTRIGAEVYIWESKLFDHETTKESIKRSLKIDRLNTITKPVRQLFGLPVGHIIAVVQGGRDFGLEPQRTYLRNNGFVAEFPFTIRQFRAHAEKFLSEFNLHIDPNYNNARNYGL